MTSSKRTRWFLSITSAVIHRLAMRLREEGLKVLVRRKKTLPHSQRCHHFFYRGVASEAVVAGRAGQRPSARRGADNTAQQAG